MNNCENTLNVFDKEYIEESKPILSNWLGRALTSAETETIIQNLLELEELMRSLNNKHLMKNNNYDNISDIK